MRYITIITYNRGQSFFFKKYILFTKYALSWWKVIIKTFIMSEGSCDTKDKSNDAENSALPSQKHMTL